MKQYFEYLKSLGKCVLMFCMSHHKKSLFKNNIVSVCINNLENWNLNVVESFESLKVIGSVNS